MTADALSLELTLGPEPAEAPLVSRLLTEHRTGIFGPKAATRKLTLLLRDAAGAVRGGMRAEIALGWLMVDKLAVEPGLRGGGHGSRLLHAAERAAEAAGAVGAYLYTSTFQAPGFYARHGYVEIGRLRGRPEGHDRIWLAKRFDGSPP